MRRVSKAGAVFALLAILITPAVYADDPPPGTEPPQMRIGPPGGVSLTAAPPQARIGPPGGVSATDEMSILDLFWLWLLVRIGPPTG